MSFSGRFMELDKSSAERNPHLPPPEVCDWLIGQEWSGRIPRTVTTHPKGSPREIAESPLFSFTTAHPEAGANEIGRIFLSVEALEVLMADQQARREQARVLRCKPSRDHRLDALAYVLGLRRTQGGLTHEWHYRQGGPTPAGASYIVGEVEA
jgi:hypothetical protein